MVKYLYLIVFSVITLNLSQAEGNNWAHWRGPYMNGSNPEAAPPINWDENTNILWKTDIPGKGSSTPIVWENKIFVTTAVKTEKVKEGVEAQPEEPQEEGRRGRRRFGGGSPPTNYYEFKVVCLVLNSGKEIWSKTVNETVPHAGHHSTNTYASGSPVTDGEHLYVTFGSYGIYCMDLDGNIKWDKDFGDMNTRAGFGEGTSLTVHDNSLIVNWDHEDQSFVAVLNKNNGDVIWQKNRDERTTWATPVVFEYDGKKQLIQNGTTRVRSYNLENGDLIWECGGQTANPIPTPIRYQDNVLCTSGFRGEALYSIPLSAEGDITGTDHVSWSYNNDTPYVPSPVLYDDHLYFLKSRDAILTCVNVKDGSVVFGPERLNVRGDVYSSLGAANGYIFVTTREGETAVIKHGDSLEIIETNDLGQTIDASPVFIGEKLLLRGENTLFCIAEK